jgi:hypothetical protein
VFPLLPCFTALFFYCLMDRLRIARLPSVFPAPALHEPSCLCTGHAARIKGSAPRKNKMPVSAELTQASC